MFIVIPKGKTKTRISKEADAIKVQENAEKEADELLKKVKHGK